MRLKTAGLRGQRIIVRKPADPVIRNDDGEVVESYTEVAQAWASIEWADEEEQLQTNQAQGQRKATIRFPWSSATALMNASWRIEAKRTGRQFGIMSALDSDERVREWIVTAIAAG